MISQPTGTTHDDVNEPVVDGSNAVACNLEGTRLDTKKYEQVTPLASFSPDELSKLRHVFPDAYQALLQYEQLCRHSSAIVQVKETELQRSIDVGQEVLSRIDALQLRCAQLAKERDDALAMGQEHESHLRENIEELQQLLEEREKEISHLKAMQHDVEDEGRRLQSKLSVMSLPAAAQIVVLHNQLVQLIERVEQVCNNKRSSSSVASTARMSVASIPTDGNEAETVVLLEQWLADSLDQTIQRTNELTNAVHLLDEQLQHAKHQVEQSERKCQESENKIITLRHENDQLQGELVALQKDVQALDRQAEELNAAGFHRHMDAVNSKQHELEEVRRQHSAQLLLLREQHGEELRSLEEETRSLRAELSRYRDGTAVPATYNSPSKPLEVQMSDHQKQQLQELVNDFESEKHRLVGVIEQLENALLDGKSSYQRLVAQYEEELQQQQLRAAELVRTAAENGRLKEQLEHATASISVVGELTKALETKELYIATLNQQIRELSMEVTKLKEAAHSSKNQGVARGSISKNYEDMEMELKQERENSQQLGASLAAVRSQLDELTVLFSEQKRRVRDCLRCPPPQLGMDRERVTSLLQASASRAATRFFNCLEQQHRHLNSLSHHAFTLYGGVEPMQTKEEGAANRKASGVAAAHYSSPISSFPGMANGLKKPRSRQQVQLEQIQKNASRFSSPARSPLLEDECSAPGYVVLQNSETAAALSTAMVRFLNDLTEAVVQQLLQPYTGPLEALQRLHSAFNPLMGAHNEHWTRKGDTISSDIVHHSVSLDNIEVSADENASMLRLPTSLAQQEKVSPNDIIWTTVTEGIIDAFVDACTVVFQRVYRAAGSQLQQCEERLKQANRQVQANCEERIRRTALSMVEGEGNLNAQLQVAETKIQSAHQALDILQGKYEKEASRCCELSAQVKRLEGRLTEKQRELETERLQWRHTVRELQDACGIAKEQHAEQGTRHQHQVQELQELLRNVRQQLQAARDEGHRLRLEVESVQAEHQQKIQWLEQEQQKTRSSEGKAEHALQNLREQLAASNTALQVKLNEETARVQRANANVESLQSVLRDAQSAYQLLQSALSDEQDRREMAEERVEGLNRELALLRSRLQVQQQRVAEMQEAERLQQCQLDAEARKNEALLRVNRALEGRLSEVEGDREPLRQQLQSLLLLKHC